MALMNESRRGAMKIEEAALMPALPRHPSSQAALESVLQSAQRMKEKQLSNEVTTFQNIPEKAQPPIESTYHPAQSRAALHHILKR